MDTTKPNISNPNNSKLQKTISNLFANLISSLSQQFISYENTINIFGVVSINIDDSTEINVKLNEKFSKNDSITNLANLCCSTLLETVAKVNDEENNTVADTAKEPVLIAIENDRNNSNPKRKPRKPLQTFRHFVGDNLQDRENQPPQINESKINLKCKTAEASSHNFNHTGTTVVTTEDSADMVIIPNYSIDLTAFTEHNESKPNRSSALFKCSICDRQFKRKFCLTRHKRVHQNSKSFNCTTCGMVFDVASHQKRHVLNMHQHTGDSARRSNITNTVESKQLNGVTDKLESLTQLWPSISALPIFPTTTSSDFQQVTSALYPPGFLVAQSDKSSISNDSKSSFLSNQCRMPPFYNSGADVSFPYSSSMYFLPNYPPILPASNNTASSNTSIASTTYQRLPVYCFPPGLLNSPSQQSVPLMNLNSSCNISDSAEKSVHPKSQES